MLDAGGQAGDDDDLARLVLGRRRGSFAFVDRFIVTGGGVTRESWSGPKKRERRADKKRASQRRLILAHRPSDSCAIPRLHVVSLLASVMNVDGTLPLSCFRPEARRVGKECVSRCRYLGSRHHQKNKHPKQSPNKTH